MYSKVKEAFSQKHQKKVAIKIIDKKEGMEGKRRSPASCRPRLCPSSEPLHFRPKSRFPTSPPESSRRGRAVLGGPANGPRVRSRSGGRPSPCEGGKALAGPSTPLDEHPAGPGVGNQGPSLPPALPSAREVPASKPPLLSRQSSLTNSCPGSSRSSHAWTTGTSSACTRYWNPPRGRSAS